ncbi:hypothetical protein [Maribellus mangrovi]|uniref:hypothetical protein n=1 Tax=Maribellus mangrovi TaxID=3133146 RepID=UPI0030EC3009
MTVKKNTQVFVLILMWILLSPLFLFLSIKWKMPRLAPRIILTIIAPMTLLIISLTSISGYVYYYTYIKRGTKSEIETKTGLNFPKFTIIEKRHKTFGPAFNGDFSMEYKVQLDTLNVQEFYKQIQSSIEITDNERNDNISYSWESNSEDSYFFNYSDYQEYLELEINRFNGEMEIRYGSL